MDVPTVALDRPKSDAPRPRSRASELRTRRRIWGLVAVVAIDALWLATDHLVEGTARWGAVAVTMAVHLTAVVAEYRSPALSRRSLVLAGAALFAFAVACSPMASRDAYQYVMYGRIAAVHHANPYVLAPSRFRRDPFLARLAPGWRHTRSVYGPGFLALASVVAEAGSSSARAAVGMFQVVAATAAVIVVAIVGRETGRRWMALLLASSPVVVLAVNGGHVDVVVGMLALLAVVLDRSRRTLGCVIALAVACSIKLIALAAVAGIVLAAWNRGERRRSVAIGAGVAAAVVMAYGLGGGWAAIGPLRHWGRNPSRASVWALAVRHHGPVSVIADTHVPAGRIALAATALAAIGVAWCLRHETDAATIVAALGIVVLVGSAYTLPWYATVFLPVAAVASHRRVAVATAAIAVALQVSYTRIAGSLHAVPGTGVIAHAMAIAMLVVAAVALDPVSRLRPGQGPR